MLPNTRWDYHLAKRSQGDTAPCVLQPWAIQHYYNIQPSASGILCTRRAVQDAMLKRRALRALSIFSIRQEQTTCCAWQTDDFSPQNIRSHIIIIIIIGNYSSHATPAHPVAYELVDALLIIDKNVHARVRVCVHYWTRVACVRI